MLNFSDEPAVQRSGDMADANTPVIPLPNPGEGGPVAPGDDTDTPVIPAAAPTFLPFRSRTPAKADQFIPATVAVPR